MLQVKTIAQRARVEPVVVNEKLIELGYQTRTRSKNCRYQPTEKGLVHSCAYTGVDATHGHEYTVYTWDDIVAEEVLEALKPISPKEFQALALEVKKLSERVAALEALAVEHHTALHEEVIY